MLKNTITREVYASARSHMEPEAVILATMVWGGHLPEKNTGFVQLVNHCSVQLKVQLR